MQPKIGFEIKAKVGNKKITDKDNNLYLIDSSKKITKMFHIKLLDEVFSIQNSLFLLES